MRCRRWCAWSVCGTGRQGKHKSGTNTLATSSRRVDDDRGNDSSAAGLVVGQERRIGPHQRERKKRNSNSNSNSNALLASGKKKQAGPLGSPPPTRPTCWPRRAAGSTAPA